MAEKICAVERPGKTSEEELGLIFPGGRRLERITCRFNDGLAAGASVIALLLMLLTVCDVSGRFLFNSPVKGSIEISQAVLPYIVWTGFAYALVMGSHVRVTLFLDKTRGRLRLALEVLADLLGLVLFATLLQKGWLLFWTSVRVNELMPAAVYIPWWASKFIVPVMLLVLSVQFLIRLLKQFARLAPASAEEGP